MEFKQSFGFGSVAKYIKTMIAFANAKGGFIVFGIEPGPHRIKGVNQIFNSLDPARLTKTLQDHVAPEITREEGTIEIQGAQLGYIYVYPATDKPVIVTKSMGTDLNEGSIYYRYRGQSAIIRFPELRQVLDERVERERSAWMRHIQAISSAGPTNVGILDTVEGKIRGPNATFLIEEPLVQKLKFIREGSFNEKKGEPTLRLIGDVQEVSGLIARQSVGVGIHVSDILSVFLAQQRLQPQIAINYVREVAYQNTHLVPVFYYVSLSGISVEEATRLIKNEKAASYQLTRKKIMERLNGQSLLQPLGSKPTTIRNWVLNSKRQLKEKLASTRPAAALRGVLVAALSSRPDVVMEAISELPVIRFCEALTHIETTMLFENQSRLLSVVLAVFKERYESMSSNERSYFRKAIAYLDQKLYK